jgi:TrmH family RNA methyltransferase
LNAATFDLGYVRGLRDRAARDRDGVYFAEGVRFLVTAADAGERIEGLVVAPEMLHSTVGQMIARRLRAAGVPLLRVSADEFVALSSASHPQGVGVVLRQKWTALDNRPPPRDALWVAAERVRSPGNLGSLLRTCEAIGATGLIRTGPDVDPYHPASVRAAMGALVRLRFVDSSLDAMARWTTRRAHLLAGAAVDGARDYRAVDYRRPVVIMLGNERRGLSAAQRGACDELVRIPMVGRTDSLNFAIAGSLLVYEAWNQRHPTRAGRRR